MYEENKSDVFLNHALGMEYLAMQAFEKAESFFRECIVLEPENTAARYQLAVLLAETKREKEALALAEEAILLLSNSKDLKTLNEFRSLRDELLY